MTLNIYTDIQSLLDTIDEHLLLVPSYRLLCCYRGDLTSHLPLLFSKLDGALYLAANEYAGEQYCAMTKAKTLLGGEYAHAIINTADTGVSAQVLGIVSGLVVKGGVFLLGLPSEQQTQAPSIESERFAITQGDYAGSVFEQRLLRLINEYCPADISYYAVSWQEAQDRVVDHLVSNACGRAHRPTVLTANRGRGKSYALGLAVSKILHKKPYRIAITASHRHALKAVYKAIDDSGGDQSQLRFLPVDKAVDQGDDRLDDLLIVDEAASIPIPQLILLATRYPRAIFSSTTHGYEGSGRGFTHRFFKALDRLRPQWRREHLSLPIRWLPGDPVEAFIDKALLLSAEPKSSDAIGLLSVNKTVIKEVSVAQLLGDRDLLEEFFGLLVGAHYQTTPDDLRMLLDSTAIKRFGVFAGQSLIAVSIVALEGQGGDIDCEQVWLGRRRTRGELVTQQLIASYYLTQAAKLTSYRIMRIAVHYDYQQQGFGRSLLTYIAAQAKHDNIDYLSSSFGVHKELLSFWQGVGFSAVKLGFRRETASGEHSVIVLQGLSEEGGALCQQAQRHFQKNFCYWISEVFDKLDPLLTNQLLHNNIAYPVDDFSLQAAKCYALANNSYENCAPALIEVAYLGLTNSSHLSSDEVTVLVMKLLQRRPWVDVVAVLGVSGLKQAELRLKQAIVSCLQNIQKG